MVAPYTFPAHQKLLFIIVDLFNILEFALVHGMGGQWIEGDKKKCMVDIYIFQHLLSLER